jgi:methylmalonyl-CoA mutase
VAAALSTAICPRRSDPPLATARGSQPWVIVQPIDHRDIDEANRQAFEDVEGGATGLALHFTEDGQDQRSGLPTSDGTFAAILEGVDLAAVHVRIDAHAHGPALARRLKALVARKGVAPELTSIAFGLDPIGTAFRSPSATVDTVDFVRCFRELKDAGFGGPLLTLDGRAFHEAGADDIQELAAVIAGALWWRAALDETGIDCGAGFAMMGAHVVIDCNQFHAIAKIRALRLLWARLGELCGVEAQPLHVHASTSTRTMDRADPHTNLLRTTIAAVAAAAGGADSILVGSHDLAPSPTNLHSRALVRNIHHLLIHESHLHRAADAAAGSGVLEALTDTLAEHAWSELQTIEREGGIQASLRAGTLQSRIAEMGRVVAGAVA